MSAKQAYVAYARLFGKDRWGAGPSDESSALELLNRMFPEARFIHLVRDGRDVALSIIRDGGERSGDASSATVIILWTGGWDSTFRVAWLMAAGPAGTVIEPYYLVDPVRKSAPREIQAMAEIARALERRFGHRGCVLKPPVLLDRDGIVEDSETERSYRSIREQQYIGGQYRSLASLLKAAGISGIELCIHKDDKAHQLLAGHVERRHDELGEHYAVSNGTPRAVETLFKYYRFPIFEMTKLDMQRAASELGVEDILALSWFCHSPDRRGAPCGVCEPCTYTIEEGLGRRVPFRGRLRYALSVRRRVKRVLLARGRLAWTLERARSR